MIARGAEPILAARRRGMKPDEMIRVSLVGSLCHGNHVVYAEPGAAYDWRWVRDLDVCVCIGPSADWAATAKAIAMQRPAHLSLWNSYEQWGAKVYLIPTAEDIKKPIERWTYELDFQPWMDFQNMDFIAGRTYARAPGGMPYALNP
ncbi:hypothetical protein BN2497_53 [Janthinobacterium sp. CG23_2]|nr:hypothetical protein BN2497_53 [Janthinobacterium sp. CG23_2]CUU26424.1 hypothetical protein BN3177_53 [Janthinobacterium sp. CG23_2]